MQNLMRKNKPQQRRVRQQLLLENNPALGNEGGGMDRAAAVGAR